MSTEVPEKKQKGGKDGGEKKSKKRPREEEPAVAEHAKLAVDAESTPAKKQKKSKKDKTQNVKQESPEAQEAIATVPEETSAKQDKKEKKKRRKAAEASAAGASVSDVKPDPAEDVPVQGSPAMVEPEQTKRPKKKSKNDATITEPETLVIPSTAPDAQRSMKTTTTAIDERLLQSKSPFVQQTASFYLALSPIAHHFPLEGLCAEHISPLLLTYYPPLKGVVLSFSSPRLSEHPESGVKAENSIRAKTVLGRSIDEYAVTYVWLTAEFLVFRPQKGAVLEGHVNLQNESILGLICYNYFNAGVERSRIPKDWRWIADESAETEAGMSRRGRRDAAGHYVDGEGKKVEGRIVFRVNDFEATAGAENGVGSINIYGTLLTRNEDAKVDDEVAQKGLVSTRTARR